MADRQEIETTVHNLIQPFNKKDVALTDATTFAGDLEWDSLTRWTSSPRWRTNSTSSSR